MAVWSFPKRPEDICRNTTAEWRWDMPSKSDDIYHHGILGQKWGDRHGPPYPLDLKTSAKISKKGNVARQKRYKDRQDKIKSGKLKRKAKDNTGMSMFMEQSHDNVWNEVMSDGKTQLAKAVGDYLKENGTEGLRYTEENIRNSRSYNGGDMPNVVTEDGDYCQSAWGWDVNPGGIKKRGQSNNCMKVTATTILQNMGFCGLSAGRCSHGIGGDAVEYWFDNAQKTSAKSGEVTEKLSAMGPGAFGGINVSYSAVDENGAKIRTGGHEIFWRNDNNGKTRFYDNQAQDDYHPGTSFTSYKSAIEHYGADDSYDAKIFRCDKATPNWEHLAEDGVIRDTKYDKGKVRNKNDNRVVDTW